MEWSLVWRILLAAGLSAIIGIEREFHGRPAGLRTHLLVGTGAALVLVAFQAAWNPVMATGTVTGNLPPEIGRLAAGVITGIGFLGAGTIIKVGDWVRGLTTAASIWFVAMLGVASGLGVWAIAVTGGLIGVGILGLVDPLASMIPSRRYQQLRLRVDATAQDDIQARLKQHFLEDQMRATLINWEWDSQSNLVTLTYRVRHRGVPDLRRIAQQASALDGVVETKIEL